MKPRLQNLLLDKLFKNYYNLFSVIFSNCEIGFVRKIIQNSEFQFHPINQDESMFDPSNPVDPVIL